MKNNKSVKEIIWFVDEFEKYHRSKRWYTFAIIAVLLLLVYSIIAINFLFAVIIIVFSIVIILNDGINPVEVKIKINEEGVFIGRKFYDYDDLKNFAIVHKQNINVSNLYFETKNLFNHRISVPLEGQNPVQIRDFLIRFLKEDYERTDLPLSEVFAKFFKI